MEVDQKQTNVLIFFFPTFFIDVGEKLFEVDQMAENETCFLERGFFSPHCLLETTISTTKPSRILEMLARNRLLP